MVEMKVEQTIARLSRYFATRIPTVVSATAPSGRPGVVVTQLWANVCQHAPVQQTVLRLESFRVVVMGFVCRISALHNPQSTDGREQLMC